MTELKLLLTSYIFQLKTDFLMKQVFYLELSSV